MTPIASHITAFLQQRLPVERGVLVALERSQKWRCCPLVFRRLDKTTPCRRLFKERISHVSQYCETFINVVKIPVVREDSLCIASIGYHLKRSSNAV